MKRSSDNDATASQVTTPLEVLAGNGNIFSGATGAVLSAQEQAIVEGKKVLHGTASDRILRMFEAIRSSGPPRVALERAIDFTESFKTTGRRLPTASFTAWSRRALLQKVFGS